MSKISSLVLFSVILIFLSSLAFSQEATSVEINQIIASAEKNTQPFAIIMAMEMKDSDVFESFDEFELLLDQQETDLMSTRLFDEVSVYYEILTQDEESAVVDVYVHVKETFNMVVLPYPKYDSNSGLLLSVRFRNYNFLGSMETFKVDLNYEYDSLEGAEHEFSTAISYAYNFEVKEQVITAELTQEANLVKVVEGDSPDNFYLSTDLSFYTNFETALLAFNRYPVFYYMKAFNDIKYNLDPDVPLLKDDREWYVGVQHGFKFGKVNWVDNYRNGFNFSLLNSVKYNLYKTDYDEYTEPGDHWRTDFELSLSYFKDFYPACYSGRTTALYQWQYYSDNGDYLRGIRNDYIESKGGLFFNNDILITVLTIGKLFEIQAGATVDLGIPFGYSEESYYKDQYYFAGGIEVIVYPLFAKSFFIRGSIGFDIKAVWDERTLGGDNWGAYFGLGHFF